MATSMLDLEEQLKSAAAATERAGQQRNRYMDSMVGMNTTAGGLGDTDPSGLADSRPGTAAAGAAGRAPGSAAAGAAGTRDPELQRLQDSLRTVEASYLNEIDQLRAAIESVDGERLQTVEMYERAVTEGDRLRTAVLSLQAEAGSLRARVVQLEDTATVEKRRREQLAFQFERDVDFFTQREAVYITTHEGLARGEIATAAQSWFDVLCAEARCERVLLSRSVKQQQLNDFRVEERMAEVDRMREALQSQSKESKLLREERDELRREVEHLRSRQGQEGRRAEQMHHSLERQLEEAQQENWMSREVTSELELELVHLSESAARGGICTLEARAFILLQQNCLSKLASGFAELNHSGSTLIMRPGLAGSALDTSGIAFSPVDPPMAAMERDRAFSLASVDSDIAMSESNFPQGFNSTQTMGDRRTSNTRDPGEQSFSVGDKDRRKNSETDRELQLLRRLMTEARKEAFEAKKELQMLKESGSGVGDGGSAIRASTPPAEGSRQAFTPPAQSPAASAASAVDSMAIATAVGNVIVDQLKPLKQQVEKLLQSTQPPVSQESSRRHDSLSIASPLLAHTPVIAGPGSLSANAAGQLESNSSMPAMPEDQAPAAGARVEPTPPTTPPAVGGGMQIGTGIHTNPSFRGNESADAALLRRVFNEEVSKIHEVLQELRNAATFATESASPLLRSGNSFNLGSPRSDAGTDAAGTEDLEGSRRAKEQHRQEKEKRQEVRLNGVAQRIVEEIGNKIERQTDSLDRLENAVLDVHEKMEAQTTAAEAHKGEVQTTIAAMRHAVRNLLVSTTHNHKLLGEKMDAVQELQQEIDQSLREGATAAPTSLVHANLLSAGSYSGRENSAPVSPQANSGQPSQSPDRAGVKPLDNLGRRGSLKQVTSPTAAEDASSGGAKASVLATAGTPPAILQKRQSHCFDDSEDEGGEH